MKGPVKKFSILKSSQLNLDLDFFFFLDVFTNKCSLIETDGPLVACFQKPFFSPKPRSIFSFIRPVPLFLHVCSFPYVACGKLRIMISYDFFGHKQHFFLPDSSNELFDLYYAFCAINVLQQSYVAFWICKK